MKPATHYVGVAGSGMSALAQLRALAGEAVTGSDRYADRGELGDDLKRLEAAGIRVYPQDGSGLGPATRRVVVSTAVEGGNPDLERARALGLPIVHRADELAELASSRSTAAIAGTSGKSTVTAMAFHILDSAGRGPSLAAGAPLPSLRRKGLLGNAWLGKGGLLVMEADESDGTVTRYRPELGVLLNASKDHKDLPELLELFRRFKSQCARFIVNADASELEAFRKGSSTFGFREGEVRGSGLELSADSVRFRVSGADFKVPVPGRHNAENALAAAAACLALGVRLEESARALESFEGVSRRFEKIGQARGVEVVDDFAHNPDKLRAAFAAARLRGRRVLAVFQLHGFQPARFMKAELIGAFSEIMGPEDVLWLPDIYYVGGTAAKDVSAKDYADALSGAGRRARYEPRREAIVEQVAAEAKAGDVVLVMGARDPSLSLLARSILSRLGG